MFLYFYFRIQIVNGFKYEILSKLRQTSNDKKIQK